MFLLTLALGLAALCLLLWYFHGRASHEDAARRYDAVERSAMPPELATARLVLSEQLIRCESPDFLVARLDQTFLTTQGFLVPIETKTRARPVIYESDRFQLGAVAVILSNAAHAHSHHPVASHGYVRLVTPEGLRYRRVDLPSAVEVLDMARRRRELIEGRGDSPRPASHPALCPKCPSRSRCPQPLR